MLSARFASRSARAARLPARITTKTSLPRARFQSTSSGAGSHAGPSSSTSSSSSHFAAGAVGGLVGAGALYGVYQYTPAGRMARRVNKAAGEAEAKYNEAAKKLREKAPSSADQAIDSMKRLAMTYAAWVPGGRAYVEAAFADVDKIRENHSDEADKIVQDAYKKLQDASKAGFSLEAASKAWDVLAEVSQRVAELAGDAAGDVLDNHPKLKERLGGSVDQLRQMGEQYGPEAKKLVDETWAQVRDIASGGLSAENINKARKLVDEKMQQVQKLGDEAWKKAFEQAKPLFEKSPKVKKIIEENADALKKGNTKELFDKARSAVESGETGDLEKYVGQAVDKAKKASGGGSSIMGGGLEEYLGKIPNGSDILPKLQQLGEVAMKHKEEGEQLLKETVEELKKVLEQKAKQAEEIAEKAKKESK
ncbi:hypothetical protein MAPG_05322 [Magnaporthiopsis poae ATCC 64411]|uniref:Uncharacterized protein n=1 Tax=Magnaporthiopsis poae (strain ATCC 64411 / 73-15) TaxID=644358 RepID=A0A0C4DZ34_MAGP6|nr:hypothetical protein MAPG_05322 [Magnaporthiopsis poae ATCC 64411]